MYLYQPVPTPISVQTIGERIAAMRATQEANPHAAALRAAIPIRIPTRVIHADQVQRELTQQSEEELQQTLADIQRAANLLSQIPGQKQPPCRGSKADEQPKTQQQGNETTSG